MDIQSSVAPLQSATFLKDHNLTSIRRPSDGQVFNVGDHVTNGTIMHGKIQSFEVTDDLRQVFVYTDYSGVGMSLESLFMVDAQELPSRLQLKRVCTLRFYPDMVPLTCTVRQVHFSVGKVKYDLDVWLPDNTSTRIYSVDSCFVEPF